jgi:hypothetical protein
MDRRVIPSAPDRNPCGWAAARPTIEPGSMGSSPWMRASPVPRRTMVHSSESGWVCANAVWSGARAWIEK